jgi:hypothetical protein
MSCAGCDATASSPVCHAMGWGHSRIRCMSVLCMRMAPLSPHTTPTVHTPMQSQDGWTTHAVRINEDNVAYFVLPPFYTHVEHISAGTFGMVVRVASAFLHTCRAHLGWYIWHGGPSSTGCTSKDTTHTLTQVTPLLDKRTQPLRVSCVSPATLPIAIVVLKRQQPLEQADLGPSRTL